MNRPDQNRRNDDQPGFFDRPRTGNRLKTIFFLFLAAAAAAGFIIPMHGKFSWEDIPLFHGLFAFAACLVLALLARLVIPLLRRGEDFHG